MHLLLRYGYALSRRRCQLSLFVLSEGRNQDEGGQQVDGEQDEEEGVGERPDNAEAFARPEGAEGGQHQADDKFERVLRHLRERRSHQRAEQDDQHAGDGRADGGGADAAGAATGVAHRAAAKSNHNKGHLKPFQQYGLVGKHGAESINLLYRLSARAQFGNLLFIDSLFIVQRLVLAVTQDGFFEPFQTKENQNNAHDEA